MVTRRDITERLTSVLGEQLVIERELGGGGMSRVFVAHETALSRRVVIKVLPDELATAISRERFRREILTSATLQHPNIVSVFAAGDADGLLYFVMPFVDGESLRARLQREGHLSPVAAVSIIRDVLRALAFAHDRGVVHRDIKPDNVLLSHGAAVVADFGVAKAFAMAREGSRDASATLTGVGMSLGTPAYMAPEQVVGDTSLDARTDLYALGAMAYEMLTGRAVFPREQVADILRAHLTDAPAPLRSIRPGIPAALENAVLQCLEKESAKRPQSAGELLARLDDPAVVSGAVTSEAAPPPVRRLTSRRLTTLLAAGVVLALGTVAGAIVLRPAPVGTTGSTAAVAAMPTVAVLPLVTASGDSADRYLAFGVTDEIISALAQARGVRVASRAAADEAQRSNLSLEQLAQRFGVTHALEGTIQRSGDDLRVAVRLLSTTDGLTVWSEVFDASATDLLQVQRFIAQSIATEVQNDLAAAADPAFSSAHQPTPEAYDLFLRAHYELSRRGDGDLSGAIDLLRRAVAADSQYAVAWAELAQAYTVLPLYGQAGADSLQADAMQAARRALAIDSGLAAAHAALGNLYNAQWRWADGAAALRRAVALDPTYAPAHQWLGENRLLNGDFAEAERAFAEAARLDSGLVVALALRGVTLALLERPVESDSTFARVLAAAPSVAAFRVMHATALLARSRWAEAVSTLEVAQVLEPGSPLVLGALGYAQGRGGNVAAARQIESRLAAAGSPGSASALAKVRLGLGDTAGAISAMGQALRAREPFFSSEPMGSPLFDAVRGLPAFASIVQGAGLDATRLTARTCC